MPTRRSLSRGKIVLATGLVAALAALGLASPLSTATAQTNSRVCGIFWYTQMPDPTNDNKPTWFTLGIAEEIDKVMSKCTKSDSKMQGEPNLAAFRKATPNLPEFLDQAESWTPTWIEKVTCEDFATYIAQPPNGEEITDGGQNWPAGDPDPCQYWTRYNDNRFWFKHL